jgi:hypothetical protein
VTNGNRIATFFFAKFERTAAERTYTGKFAPGGVQCTWVADPGQPGKSIAA